MSSPHRDQGRMSDPLKLDLQMVGAARWVLGAKLGPLQEQQRLSTTEPSLHSQELLMLMVSLHCIIFLFYSNETLFPLPLLPLKYLSPSLSLAMATGFHNTLTHEMEMSVVLLSCLPFITRVEVHLR